jgi:hypothetical protein
MLTVLLGFKPLSQNIVYTGNKHFSIPPKFHTKTGSKNSLNKTSSCAIDTVEYPLIKLRAFSYLILVEAQQLIHFISGIQHHKQLQSAALIFRISLSIYGNIKSIYYC